MVDIINLTDNPDYFLYDADVLAHIFALTGNDFVQILGDTDSAIFGGAGNDGLIGGDGNNILAGDAGADRLYGLDGDDKLVGGSGVDLLSGGAGDDLLIDNDNPFGYATQINGGIGSDVITATNATVNTGFDILGVDSNTVHGRNLIVTDGNGPADIHVGTLDGGTSRINAQGGDDVFRLKTANPEDDGGLIVFNGGAGHDTAYLGNAVETTYFHWGVISGTRAFISETTDDLILLTNVEDVFFNAPIADDALIS